MKNGIRRQVLRLVPAPWRESVAEDVMEDAQSQGRGPWWCVWQTFRAAVRMRISFATNAFGVDLVYATRSLLHARWFTVGAILTFALGIGVNVAVFSAIDRMLFRQLPYARPEEIVVMKEVDAKGTGYGTMPALLVVGARQRHSGFADLSNSGFTSAFNLSREPDGAPLRLTEATHNTLELFGVHILRGRDFSEDDARSKQKVALLSFDAWKARFGGTDEVIGRHIWQRGQSFEIVGVLPEQFIPASSFLDPRSDGFVLDDTTFDSATPNDRSVPPYVRLKPGVTLQAAQAELDVLTASIRRESLAPRADEIPTTLRLTPLRSVLFSSYSTYLALVAGAAALVLAVACANLGSLMLVRNRSREQQTATHIALGASTWRLMRTGILESGLLSLAGAGVALLVLGWSTTALRSVLPPVFSRYATSIVDPRVLLFALVAAIGCTVVAGVYPSWRITRVDVLGILQKGCATMRSGRVRGGRSLLVVESAFSLMLVAGSAMTLRSFTALSSTELGFTPGNLYGIDVTSTQGLDGRTRYQQTFLATDALKTLPTVVAAAAADINQVTSNGAIGNELGPGFERTDAFRYQVTDQYFDTMGMHVVAGRTMTATEVHDEAAVGVLSESGLRLVWPGTRPADAIGRMLEFPAENGREIVGIVSDVRPSYAHASYASLYVPLRLEKFRTIMFAARVSPGAKLSVSDVRSRLREAGVEAAAVSVRSMTDQFNAGLTDQKFRAILFSSFAATALLLAVLGLYAVSVYEVSQRQHEMGIRLAIGASGHAIRQLIVRQALMPVLVGTLVGTGATYWAAASMQSFLYDVDARDPGTLTIVSLLMLAATAMAAWIPAYRAARLDPATILRAH